MNLIGKCHVCLLAMMPSPAVDRRLTVVCNASETPPYDDGICRCGQPYTLTTDDQHQAWLEHSATCPGHPAVILAKQLRAACLLARRRFDEQNGQVSPEVWGDNYPAVKALGEALAASASLTY